jgi:hypothetical protein
MLYIHVKERNDDSQTVGYLLVVVGKDDVEKEPCDDEEAGEEGAKIFDEARAIRLIVIVPTHGLNFLLQNNKYVVREIVGSD